MVKARHKAIGGRICVYPTYIETRRSNRRQNLIRSDIIDSDDSGIVKVRRGTRGAIMRVQNHESNELDIPVKNLRSRRRSYGQYEDPITTEEEDNTLPDTKVSNTRRVKKRSNKISEIRTKEMKGVICDHNNGELQIRRSSRPRKPVILDFEYDPSPTRRSTRQKKPPAIFQEINSEDEKEYNVRRSGRQRKFVYDKLSQKDILRTQENGYEEDDRRKRKHSNSDSQDDNEGDDQDFRDMYSRVKRPRRKVKRDMYGIPLQDSEDASTDDDEGSSTEESTSESDECENSSNEEQEEIDDNNNRSRPKRKVTQLRSAYHLRENKPRTKIYEAPPIESRTRKIRNQSLFTGSRESPPGSPVRRNKKRHKMYRSPAHRRKNFRRHAVSYGSSSSTSSSSSSSSDEEKFEKRRAKSMAKARNRCMPMNLSRVDLSSGIMKDRARVGASLADIDPMSLDKSVKFDSVGGLGKHIRSLKEMVVFPLLYPEVFERFKISPPRGVLFYGPPGTGKTLVARALANECSSDDRRVSFFMRKGADCLSKWVGESERQLRLLFDQAYQMRPSIIFFDEIDGLAPVRSSRQDQIHSSIVSTLLALMDGLDNRGEVVVIGATNRIDSIDPALRRPGRFDREFLFPLPSASARKQIINIHTKDWNPKLSESFVEALSEKSVGFCGADLKALCTEAALQALRRRYPQIYTSTEKLQLDVTTIQISAKDFFAAMNVIVPTSQRSVTSPAKAFSPSIAPLFKAIFTKALEKIHDIFPTARSKLSLIGESVKNLHQKHNMNEEDMEDFFSDDEETISIHHDSCRKRRNSTDGVHSENIDFQSYAIHHPSTYRPRILLSGKNGQGQTTHLAPAILHYLEHLPVHVLDLPTLYAASAKTPEESCAQVFREARRACPSVIYLPHVNEWWDILSDTLRATLLMLVQDLDPSASLLLLATSEEPAKNLDTTLQELFSQNKGEVLAMTNPCAELRKRFFSDLILNQTNKRPPGRKQAAKRILEILPRAPPPEPKKLTDAEIRSLREQEENTLRELRIFLRDVLNKLGRDRKFTIFAKPVDVEEVVDYYDIISHPMDLSTMMTKIDCREYNSVRQFLTDIDLICSNALEYNPSRAPTDRAIRHRACALKDTAAAIVKTELDPEFEKLCAEIVQSRQRRGENESTAPEFYHTLPSRRTSMHSTNIPPSSSGSRQSRRVRGMEVEVPVDVEAVERSVRIERSMTNTQGKQKEHQSDKNETPIQKGRDHSRGSSSVKKQSRNSVKRGSSAKSKPRKKEVWSYKKRKRRPFRFFSSRPKSRSGNISDVEVLDDGDYSDEQDAQTPDSRSKIDEVAHSSLKSDHRSSMKKLSTPERHLSPSRSRSPRRQVSPARSNVPCKSEGSKHTTPIADSKAALSSIAPAIQTHLGDSGVGSSLDSNGDSRDSTDHAKAVSDKMKTPEKTAEFMDNRQSRRAGSCSPPPVIHVTRSKDKTKHQQMAIDILEESIPPLVIDNDKLHNLLEYVVRKTHDYTVEDLEKLYSLLSQCIFRHRMEHDKAALVTDMEQKIHVFTSH